MDYGEQTTGTRDEHYNLVSVLYHALHGAENCDRYAADAEGGATTGGGEAREAGGGAHDTADPARRTTGGRGEAREAYTVIGDPIWREEGAHER